jgi:hypothetical protein
MEFHIRSSKPSSAAIASQSMLNGLPARAPHPHIRYDPLVPTAASVQLSSNIIASGLTKVALIGCVDTLIDPRNDLECPINPLSPDLLQPLLDSLELAIAEDADLVAAPCLGNAIQDILRVEHSIVVNRLVV